MLKMQLHMQPMQSKETYEKYFEVLLINCTTDRWYFFLLTWPHIFNVLLDFAYLALSSIWNGYFIQTCIGLSRPGELIAMNNEKSLFPSYLF